LPVSTYPKRYQTELIVVHVLKNIPETVTERDLADVFQGFGLRSTPFHFVVFPNGDIEDGRDVTDVGGYLLDSLDVAVLCGESPSSVQESCLEDLIGALLLDFPWTGRPKVKIIEEERFQNTGRRIGIAP